MTTTRKYGLGGLRTFTQTANECPPTTVCPECRRTNHDACDGSAWTIDGLPDGCVCAAWDHEEIA